MLVRCLFFFFLPSFPFRKKCRGGTEGNCATTRTFIILSSHSFIIRLQNGHTVLRLSSSIDISITYDIIASKRVVLCTFFFSYCTIYLRTRVQSMRNFVGCATREKRQKAKSKCSAAKLCQRGRETLCPK